MTKRNIVQKTAAVVNYAPEKGSVEIREVAVPEIGEDLYADECVVGDEPVRETISATVLPYLALDVIGHGHRTVQTP